MAAHGARRMSSHLASDEGSAGYSTLIVVLSFFTLLGLGVAGMRIFIGAGDLQAAAQSAARAAALEHEPGLATTQANAVATAEVQRAEEACENLQVALDLADFRPGGDVEVTLTCTVSYQGLYVPFMGSSRPVTVRAVEPIDCLRGGGNAPIDDNCYLGG